MMLLVIISGLFLCVMSKDPEWTGTDNVPLGSSLKLRCNDSRVLLQPSDSLSWNTPDGKVLTSPYNRTDYELTGSQGEELTIKKVTLANHGLYTCVLSQGDTPRAYLLKGVNLSGPLYASMNEKYEENIIVAVISSAVFAVPLIGLCALQKFRYKHPKRTEKTELRSHIMPSHYENSEKNGPPAGVVNPGADFSTQL